MNTNSISELSNQIVLLEQHIITLESNNTELASYVERTISHADYLAKLDGYLLFSGIFIAIVSVL